MDEPLDVAMEEGRIDDLPNGESNKRFVFAPN